MSCCCTTPFKVCPFPACGDELVLPAPILQDGVHRLELDFLGSVIVYEAALSEGDNATFSLNDLNEDFTYLGRIRQPDGSVLTFPVGDDLFNCVQITTKKYYGPFL